MRRKELDWIRNLAVLMLFLYHTSVIFAYSGDWYVRSGQNSTLCTVFILSTFPWYMPLLFFISGAATKFSLESREENQYFRERLNRLLVPFLFGLLVIVPPQTYLARLWRGQNPGSYFEHLKYFFTHVTDFTGYDGSLAPGHLWFILFLFVISLLGMPLIKLFRTPKGISAMLILKKKLTGRNVLWWLLLIFFICEIFPEIAGQSIVIDLTLFLLGYIVYSDEEYLKAIDKYKRSFLIITLVLIPIGLLYFYNAAELKLGLLSEIAQALIKDAIMSSAIVSIIGYGREYLNRGDSVLKYLNKACFPVYILHQTVVVITAYFVLHMNLIIYVSIILIVVVSVIITFTAYEICRRIKFLRVLLGMK
ncbi:MAG: acyltransferase [Bacillota bacterium]|nr:acyltransferase [Bacillota bacterium]